eukprot:TRINITY_DN372_c0_g3_i1.p1 TRINITY_DN372_c0_g3~~TRINITY_DN372_c0_g3_i1.p1  ORF type:complete len:510 (-),score=167.46 TRINITY_DN372_c0_g3_i1:12-1475(-)
MEILSLDSSVGTSLDDCAKELANIEEKIKRTEGRSSIHTNQKRELIEQRERLREAIAIIEGVADSLNKYSVESVRKMSSSSESTEEEGETDVEYEVERVLASKEEKDGQFFLIRWKGFDYTEDSWEPLESLQHLNIVQKWQRNKQVSEIVKKKRGENGEWEFQVNWSDGDDSNSWVSFEDVKDTQVYFNWHKKHQKVSEIRDSHELKAKMERMKEGVQISSQQLSLNRYFKRLLLKNYLGGDNSLVPFTKEARKREIGTYYFCLKSERNVIPKSVGEPAAVYFHSVDPKLRCILSGDVVPLFCYQSVDSMWEYAGHYVVGENYEFSTKEFKEYSEEEQQQWLHSEWRMNYSTEERKKKFEKGEWKIVAVLLRFHHFNDLLVSKLNGDKPIKRQNEPTEEKANPKKIKMTEESKQNLESKPRSNKVQKAAESKRLTKTLKNQKETTERTKNQATTVVRNPQEEIEIASASSTILGSNQEESKDKCTIQ